MDISDNATCMEMDPHFLLRTVETLDIEWARTVNSDVSKWWLLLYSELWKLWWRWHHVWSFLKSSAHNARIQQLSHELPALHDPKSRSQFS